MHIQSLNGDWQFRQANSAEWLPAIVPGGVHTDLLANGRIPDPFVGDNEKRVQWVAESDWVYRANFSCPSEYFNEEKIFLVCDGLDTLATVVLNGHELGRTDNMFRRYEWEVKAYLNATGENELTHHFRLASEFCYGKASHSTTAGSAPGYPGWSASTQGALPIWLGLGSTAAADRHLEGYPPGRLQRGQAGR